MGLVDNGTIQPVIYEEDYRGLEAVPKALEDAKNHRAWGRAILTVDEDAERKSQRQKAKL